MRPMGFETANGNRPDAGWRLGRSPEEGAHALPIPRSNGKLMTAHDVAELIGMRPDYVYALSRRGQIPHLRFGRTLRFRRESIEEWMRAVERAPARP